MDIVSITKKISTILEGTERSLVTLASEAAVAREYDVASALIELAREIEHLPKRYSHLFVGDRVPEKAEASGPLSPPAATAPVRPTPSPKSGTYPQFVREGDNLVKIGWSKADKSEYQHKSPKAALDALVGSLEKIGAGGKRFAMESVIPLMTSEDGSEIPPYQVYLCLAWLRRISAVTQHGRQGYSLKRDKGLAAAAEEAWRAMAAR
jgi:hypothetical protein